MHTPPIKTVMADIAGRLAHLQRLPLKTAVILGSGLGTMTSSLDLIEEIPYGEIPHLPQPTIKGHAGTLCVAKFGNGYALLFSGRFHYYEGHSLDTVVLPVRIAQALGITSLVVTNAAGGIGSDVHPGDLMLISDHINLTGANPLRGPHDPELGERFPDMSHAYPQKLRDLARHIATSQGLALKEGVYAGLSGPCYETPAEIRMLRAMGADAVGMSTVPEVIVASQAKMQVLGISCISNYAAGITSEPLNHKEVIEVTERVRASFAKLVAATLESLCN